jgi:hypothetical protein
MLASINFIPIYAHAAGDALGLDKARSAAPLPDKEAQPILDNIVGILLGLVGSLALLAIVGGGFMYVTSFGDESKTKKAKTIIQWAIVGLAVAILSFSIINTVTGFLKP